VISDKEGDIDRFIYHFSNNYSLFLHMCFFCSTFVAKWRRRRNGLVAMNAASGIGRPTLLLYPRIHAILGW
jgi:hypothetical protein